MGKNEAVNYRKKWNRQRRRQAVPMKYLDNPRPGFFRRVLPYAIVFVVLFWLLHFVMHVG